MPIDRFIQAQLEAGGFSLTHQVDRATLVRRVAFDLTGLPPSQNDIRQFEADQSPEAYEQMVERFLASPLYGERWGKWWLDVAGYADSNGYFNADSDRPLAYRYRDYVIRSFNEDKPFDEFIREQIAGDELSGFDPKQHERTATPRMIELIEATHFLRNSPDGSGESDGNPEEVRIDRYYALDGTQQILGSSLLGLTIQCAKCHDHKFEPIPQRDYYQLQAHLFPIFNLDNWIKPNDRFVYASLPGEAEAWESRQQELERHVAVVRADFSRWVREHRPAAAALFSDDFEGPDASFTENWSNTAPNDDAPGGTAVVQLLTSNATLPEPPAAVRRNGTLQLVEGGATGDKWLSTTKAFDWTPDKPGEWIQVTFDLLDNKVRPDEHPAARIAFFLSLCDFNDNGKITGGNILFDGNPAGGAAVFVDYPGTDQAQRGTIGTSGYIPGRNFAVRVTNIDNKKFRLEQLVDWIADDKPLDLMAEDLPDGGFGFEFCCGRSFIVDNVVIESSSGQLNDEATQTALKKFREEYDTRRKALTEASQNLLKQKTARPGKIAWASDLSADPPKVPLLVRGNVMTPGEFVPATTLRALTDFDSSKNERKNDHESTPTAPSATRTTGRRTALANWLTQRDSRAAALMARVQANRIWQRHFGRGIVATTENLGVSGAVPSHPELLEWLAAELAETSDSKPQAWSLKRLHRAIMNSATYRQDSSLNEAAIEADPDNVRLWRYPVRRLDAEAIRDGMLSVSGELDRRFGGPYIPTQRSSAAEVLITETQPGAKRRSVYLQQRRTQTVSLLNLFDAPSVTFNCVQRPTTTMPLQSLSLLNSEFALSRAREMANRLDRESLPDPRHRIRFAFELSSGRLPNDEELRHSLRFVEEQTRIYEPTADAAIRAWSDLCQMLLASNGFLYVE
ncbi:MAG: DUF1549 and DUF1553 domain-containing protein [Planctomycetia bacterium]|nr:DUF1549 and DUF1553 domain-containing protein [Planctomycetia bacterium]